MGKHRDERLAQVLNPPDNAALMAATCVVCAADAGQVNVSDWFALTAYIAYGKLCTACYVRQEATR